MSASSAYPSRAQSLTSLVVLAVLALVALGVWLKQGSYDPRAWGVPPALKGQAAGVAGGGPLDPLLDLAALIPPGLTAMGPAESFDPGSLSDKIDGKAELYLAAGFKALATRRYQLAAEPALWLEAYVFAMAEDRGAFSVFSVQRRSEARTLDLTPNAYQTTNAVFLAQGPYYLEIVASAPRPELTEATRAWAKAWLALAPAPAAAAGPAEADERGLLPPGMLPESLSLLASDVFGFDKLNQVFVATYALGGEEATAFLSRRADPAEAGNLARDYAALLLANGGQARPVPEGLAGAQLIEVAGTWELVFSQGRFLAGVHQAESAAAAQELGMRLHDSLKKVGP
jgi:hypothetical protein